MAGKIPLPLEVLSALRSGNKVEAIRLIREKTKIGLAEAKALVDAYDKLQGGSGTAKVSITKRVVVKHAADPFHLPGMSPGEVPRTGGTWQVAAAIIVAVVLGMLWFKLG